MRLRLRIERNSLPPTQAVWPVKDAKCTIAQLLELVNLIFPLEADTWGLEDYAVSVGGYECLHYHEVQMVFKDDDEVVIRPLQYVDVRSRTLTGRDQIAADGRHLVDGVPFGRPALKAPVRPEIRIPPRKKRKLNLPEDGAEDDGSEEARPLMLMESGEELDDDDGDEEDENDEDFEADASSSDGSSSDESERSEDSESSSDDDSSESGAEDTSASDSDNAESWDGIPSSEPLTPSRKTDKTVLTNGIPEHQLPPAEKSTESKRKQSSDETQERDTEHGHETRKRKGPSANTQGHDIDQGRQPETPKIVGVPFEGKRETQRRNVRRRNTKQLKYLKSIGVLPKDATLATLLQWQENNEGTEASQSLDGIVESNKWKYDVNFEAKRQKLLSDIASGGVEVKLKCQGKFGKRRKMRLSDTASGAADVTTNLDEDDEPPSEEDNSRLPPPPLYSGSLDREEPADSTTDKATSMLAPSTTPRSRLDLAGSKRLVFGSLGVRVPKTQQEKDELQKKLAERPRRNVQSINQAGSPNVNGATPTPTEIHDEEDWRSNINLTAVECSDKNVILSAPPFPFHQRWDPQYKKKKAKKRVDGVYMEGGGGKKRKRGGGEKGYVETYDKYYVNGDGDALDYDGAEEDDEEYWEEGALLNGGFEGEDDDDEEEGEKVDDFPALPANLEELPVLNESDACHGDFITFTELACDESTEWQPKMVARTARVVSLRNDAPLAFCVIQLSPRDIRPKVFDEEGNRVYSKFEMPGADADDEGEREIDWAELGDVRLVLRPEEAEAHVV